MKNESRIGSAPIVIPDGKLYTAEDLVVPPSCIPYLKGVLIPGGIVRDRVAKLAYDIRKHYKQGELHVLCLLKGSHTFFGTLVDSIAQQKIFTPNATDTLEIFYHFVRISTYRNAAATGEVNFTAEDLSCLKGKDVLVADDIVESGRSVQFVEKWLEKFEPKSIRVVSLLQVRREGQMPAVDFVGFTTPVEWFVGYGIDYNERFRDLPHVCVLSEAGKKAFAI